MLLYLNIKNVIQIYSGESTIQTYTIAGMIQSDSKQDIRELGAITNTNYTRQEKIRVFNMLVHSKLIKFINPTTNKIPENIAPITTLACATG